jgi:hypothetical protein
MAGTPEYRMFFGSNTARLERVKLMQRTNWAGFLDATLD